MNRIIEDLFPMFCNRKTNKILKERINNYNNQNADGISKDIKNLSKDEYKKIFAETVNAKNTFEDKAKTNIIGVTITISLITGSISLFDRINKYFLGVLMQWLTFAMYVVAVAYMLIAGIQAIRILCDDNIVFSEPRLGDNASPEEVEEKYIEAISKNRLQNLIRNNGIFTSYECIRNALFCLMVVLVIAVFPYNTLKDSKDLEYIKYTYAYTSETMSFLEKNDINYDVRGILEKYINKDSYSEEINAFVDKENQIVIRFIIKDDVVSILSIEPCEVE